MSESRDAYEALINAGVAEDSARQFIKDETGEDPIGLLNATVTLTLTITVDLDESDLEDLGPDDEDAIIERAEDKFDVSGWNVSLDQVDSAEIVEIDEK
jgi:hypothetical protein